VPTAACSLVQCDATRPVDPAPEAVPNLTDIRQRRAIIGLLAGGSIAEVARDANVHRVTLWRWMNEDATFIAQFNALEQDLARAARRELLSLGRAAVGVVKTLLLDPDVPPAVRLSAAQTVLRAQAEMPLNGPTTVQGAERELVHRRIRETITNRDHA
jgi:hypothetical protein